MADYRELLRKAVDALPENNGAARRQVYEKARSALVSQLRAINPPLPPRDITQHRLQLEDCIRQVEQQATDALLGGLQQLDTDDAPVEAAPPEAAPEPPAPVEADTSEPEVTAPAAVTEEVEPEAIIEEPVAPVVDEETAALQAALRAQEETPEVAASEPEVATEAPEPAAVEPEPEPEAQPSEVSAQEAPVEESVEPVVVPEPQPEVEPEPVPEVVEPKEHTPEPEPIAAPQVETPPVVEPEPVPVEDVAPAVADVAVSEPAPVAEPKPGSIDYMIAQAQAAADRAAIPTRWQTDGGVPSLAGATSADGAMAAVASSSDNVTAISEAPTPNPTAMSAEREVEVEAPAADKKEDEAQVAIDRAIETLDREARGESTGDAKSDGPAEAETVLAGSLPPSEDGRGGNAVTIFLLLFALLLAGVGGAGYWAWREGYIDIETMFAQGETPTEAVVTNTEPVTDTADVEETPTGPGNTAATPDAVTPVSEELVNNEERLVAETPETPQVVEETPVEPVEVPLPDEDIKTEDRLPTTEAFDNGNGNGQATEVTENGETVVANTEATPALAPVGAQSLLLEASSEGTTGAVPFSGTVDWSRGVDELGQPTLLATANIPARNLSVDLLIRRNADPTLPASHLMEVDFAVTESFIGGAIAGLPGILLKNEELVRGVPLVGASARVIGNSFLFALSASDQDIGTNTNLLRSRKWMDLAMVYATGNRAIITLEKDEAAQALFDEVMSAWASAAEAETPAAQ